ncbi:MAG TPA: MFS transporter [Cytophagaceae bacterium]|jgi:MFS family permease|nr:MFS transporter [Cytophagaceae bacterium]
MKIITRTVWILSFVSLFADLASEMLYPIMPVYLKTIGFSVLLIGILEGIAEATAGLSKGYFGKLSDASGKRLPFVRLGYLLSAASKPLMATFVFPFWIFAARTIDRLGKGIRTGSRDALLSDEATPETKGRVFGLHRSMDTLGAVLGPLFALLYLYLYPGQYKTLFFIAFVPGLSAVLITYLLKEQKKTISETSTKTVSFFVFIHYWKDSSSEYKKLTIGLLVFALFNSSDAFLLLKMKEAGLDDTAVIGIYIFYNLVYAMFGYPFGHLADKLGFKKTITIGFTLFALVYLGMALAGTVQTFVVLFFLYGLYAAATESVAKAWISSICAKKDTATALGTYSGFQSLCTMLASSLAGLLWLMFGASATFLTTAIATALIIIYFLLYIPSRHVGKIPA